MRARTFASALAAFAAAGAATLPALARSPGRTAAAHSVVIKNSRYTPGTISIKRGDTVTWLWRDGKVQHNVVASGFRSKVMSQGSFTVRFTRSGSFSYKCTVHPKMSGRILVK